VEESKEARAAVLGEVTSTVPEGQAAHFLELHPSQVKVLL